MNLIERAKNMLTIPKLEWPCGRNRNCRLRNLLLIGYVLPMAILASLGKVMGGLYAAAHSELIFSGFSYRFCFNRYFILYFHLCN